MPATKTTGIRLTDDQKKRFDVFRRLWGPVAPLSYTEVVLEMLRRTEAELATASDKTRRKGER